MIYYNTASELYHYGIKGMRWGVRRYQNADGSLTSKGIKRYATAGYTQDSYNSNKTRAGKAYDKVTGAHKYGGKIMYDLSSKSERKARAEKYVADQKASKEAKTAQKKAINESYKKIYKQSSLGEKLVYNPATMKRAASYVVKNNMSVEDAKKRAKSDAWKNTAIFCAGYGAITMASIYKMNH